MVVAFIPVRGGSKSIPLKNIKKIADKPLVFWAVKAANDCTYIDRVYVSTDSKEIADVVNEFRFEKVYIVRRSIKTASDDASTESAMLEFARNTVFNTMILIQATSPLVTCADLAGGFELYNTGRFDSLLSVLKQKRFIWKDIKDDVAQPVNYDYRCRPRRQEFEGYLVENGAFYIMSREGLLNEKSRLFGNVGYYIMPEETYYEIDEPIDWVIVELLLNSRIRTERTADISNIKLFITDCDAC